jgi:hypothetical protein
MLGPDRRQPDAEFQAQPPAAGREQVRKSRKLTHARNGHVSGASDQSPGLGADLHLDAKGPLAMTQDVIPTTERTSPAAVAYDLMRDILLDDPLRPAPSSPEFRPYLLDLYAECLLAVRGKRVGHQRPMATRASSTPRDRERREPPPAAKTAKPN